LAFVNGRRKVRDSSVHKPSVICIRLFGGILDDHVAFGLSPYPLSSTLRTKNTLAHKKGKLISRKPRTPSTQRMIGTRHLINRGVPLVARRIFQQQAGALSCAHSCSASQVSLNDDQEERQRPIMTAFPIALLPHHNQQRYFCAAFSPREDLDVVQKKPDKVTKSLRVLDMDVVKQILEELKSVDVNSDGRQVK